MTITRREAMKHGGKAVAATAALSVFSTIAVGASEDAELLSRIEEFWAAHKETTDNFQRWIAEKDRVEALPECPPLVFPVENREAYERHNAFLRDHSVDALCDAANEANRRQGKAVKAVFDIPGRTHQGVLAKLKIVEVAYGNGEDGDEDLECWQDQDAPWLENAIGDFEQLAGGVS